MNKLTLPNGIEYPIVEQPDNDCTWLDYRPFIATHVPWAKGVVLLSHSAWYWAQLQIGQIVVVDGQEFTVVEKHSIRALKWNDPYSDFEDGNEIISSSEAVNRYYRDGYLTLQTCVSQADRLFVICQ